MNDLISVVIPVYNRANMIIDTISSVLKQTYQNFEIIIVDDGSTDNTREIVKNIIDRRIIYIYQENAGPSAARNNGIKNANGEYIAFLDSDDYWFKEKLEKQMQIINNNPNIGIISCWAFNTTFENKIIAKKTCYAKNSQEFVTGILLKPHRVISETSSMIIKRECFDKVGYFDEEMIALEDWDMWYRASIKYDFCCSNEILMYYRVHEGLSQKTDMLVFRKNYLRFLDKIYNNYDIPDYVINIKNKVYSNVHYIVGWWALCRNNDYKMARQDLRESLKYSYLKIFNPEFAILLLLSYLPVQIVNMYTDIRKFARKRVAYIGSKNITVQE